MTLGRLLHQMRIQRRLTQMQLARLVGTNQTAISRWENDLDRPTPQQLQRLGQVLERPLAEREYLDVLLPLLISRLLQFGEVSAQRHRAAPSDLAVERYGRLIATPFLLEAAEPVRNVEDVIARWLELVVNGAAEAGNSQSAWSLRDDIARAVATNEIRAVHGTSLFLDHGYLDHPLPVSTAVGALQQNLECAVMRPIMPRPSPSPRLTRLSVGRFIPVLRQRTTSDEPLRSPDLLDDPVHSAVMLLATASRFPSSTVSATIFDIAGELSLHIEGGDASWSGPLHDGVRAALRAVDFLCITPLGREGWAYTARVAVDELVDVHLLRMNGPCVEVCEDFWSRVAANPGHRLNRGEKQSRARISERFFAMLNGDAHA